MKRKSARRDTRSVVDKRKANNAPKKRRHGLENKVADNDPMAKDSESNWP